MILITGATGAVGRPLVSALVERGAPVRVLTRDPAATGFPDGVDIAVGDPSRPDTVADHLDGVSAVFLNSRATGEATAAFADLARRKGARRLVALAGYNIEQDFSMQPSRFLGDRNRECEDAAIASGLEWVSLRPHVYSNMAHVLWGGQLAAGDEITWPYPDFAEAAIDPLDVGEVAARALLDDDLVGTRPVLTGPEAISHTAMVAALAEATGRPLRYVEPPLPDFVERFGAMGMAPELTASLIARYAVFDGRPVEVTGEIERILGRPARSYLDWAAAHADLFAKAGA